MDRKPSYEEVEQRAYELERELAKQGQLEEQMRLLSIAIEQSSEGIVISDLDGNLKYINTAFAEIHGYSQEKLAGKNLSVFHTPQQMPSIEAANQELKEKGNFKGEILYVKRDGSVFPTLMHNSLVRNTADEPIFVIAALRDITRQKQADEVLRESEERYRILFEKTLNPILIIHHEGNCLDGNEAALGFLECTRRELLAKNVKYFIPNDIDRDLLDEHKPLCDRGGIAETSTISTARSRHLN